MYPVITLYAVAGWRGDTRADMAGGYRIRCDKLSRLRVDYLRKTSDDARIGPDYSGSMGRNPLWYIGLPI